eukprot:CAMPEP_0119101514 /NCGR_PEP_ID=MMETSP1180-20130426/553_1 /TAXON_ID=3052 ORGANISM="Chlamydomonas cf sp, Strain CCMP681" /NCGR_SAMPLE_ID=MMETSP1180 /ASSEMBLY_ACC=CAM_ASM_000741 /LENGTH=160 /DNA_ID=CAMNT_0007085649 /DNA_START=25 /DNA_END=507 /DNA_ORIENTATION=-
MAATSGDAQSLKDSGNALFKAKEYLKAAAAYTQALKLDPENAVLYSNRCAALTKLNKINKALEDADRVISLKPDWEKGYWRKGEALEEAKRVPEALKVYQAGLKLVPGSKELSSKVRQLDPTLGAKQQQPTQEQQQQQQKPLRTGRGLPEPRKFKTVGGK